jgi:hypothetical protein
MNMNINRHTAHLTASGKLSERWHSGVKFPLHGVYVFKRGNDVVRFGEATNGFSRWQAGFNQRLRHKTKKKNYLAYQWRDRMADTPLEIRWYTSESPLLRDQDRRRAIEAELAYQHRRNTGHWPEFMVEIHFAPLLHDDEWQFVEAILQDLGMVRRLDEPVVHST